MFTGVIQEIGIIKNISTQKSVSQLQIEAPLLAPDKKNGDSLAVDGACLTITDKKDSILVIEAIPETLQHTIIDNYQKGTKVNLENPLKIGNALDGHFVLGHVDFVTKVLRISALKDSKVLQIAIPENQKKYCALKGSITINGVSLTISKLDSEAVEVSLIPYTLKHTNLDSLTENDQVNVEIDLISRYLESLLKDKAQETTYQFLQERGFL